MKCQDPQKKEKVLRKARYSALFCSLETFADSETLRGVRVRVTKRKGVTKKHKS